MEKILSPEKLEIANRHWADTVMLACAAKTGENLDDRQTSALTDLVIRQMFCPNRIPTPARKFPTNPIFRGVNVPTKRRGSPATASPAGKKPRIADRMVVEIESVEKQGKSAPPATVSPATGEKVKIADPGSDRLILKIRNVEKHEKSPPPATGEKIIRIADRGSDLPTPSRNGSIENVEKKGKSAAPATGEEIKIAGPGSDRLILKIKNVEKQGKSAPPATGEKIIRIADPGSDLLTPRRNGSIENVEKQGKSAAPATGKEIKIADPGPDRPILKIKNVEKQGKWPQTATGEKIIGIADPGSDRPAPSPDGSIGNVEKPAPAVTVTPLPARFREAMSLMGLRGDEEITFLAQKALTGTDVGRTQNRLQIPATKIKAAGFLTAAEERSVESADGMVVAVVEPSCEEVSELRLRLWKMSNNKYYALVNRNRSPDDSPHKWHSLVTRNRIRKDDTIQVWSFRVGPESRLCLALVKV